METEEKVNLPIVKYCPGCYNDIVMGKRIDIEEQLRQELAKADVSRYQLAQTTGISQAMLSRFLRGERHIGLRAAAKLAKALGFKLVLKAEPRLRKGR